MRRCPTCDNFTDHFDVVCHQCFYLDPGWAEHILSLPLRAGKVKAADLQLVLPLAMTSKPSTIEYPAILVSPFSDSSELGYHLYRIQDLLESNPGHIVKVALNLSEWAYTWDYGDETDPNLDVYLPPNLPLPALVETARFVQYLLSKEDIDIHLVQPPRQHAATQFLLDSGVFTNILISSRTCTNHPTGLSLNPGCDTVLVPLTYIGPQTHGQLSNNFYHRFNQLLAAGIVQDKYRSSLLDVVMEATANADQWGGGGWVIAFLRQEKRGVQNFGHRNQSGFSPVAETHLYLHVFSIGPTLAQTTGKDTEWEAATAVVQGYSLRQSGGGLGMPRIIEIVTKSTQGTVYISSGGYIRLITPDSLAREFSSAGTHYLPGVHLCAVVPLAYIANIQSAEKVAA